MTADAAAARFTMPDMERAYQDGVEDTVEKIVSLIRQSDNEIPVEDIVAFCEAEIGFGTPDPAQDSLFADLPEPGPLTVEALRDALVALESR